MDMQQPIETLAVPPEPPILEGPAVLLQASRIHHERVITRMLQRHNAIGPVFKEDCTHGDVGTLCFRSSTVDAFGLLAAVLSDVPLCSALTRQPFVADNSTDSKDVLQAAFCTACAESSIGVKLSAPSSIRRSLIEAAMASPHGECLATHNHAAVFHVASSHRGATFLYYHAAVAAPPQRQENASSHADEVATYYCASEAKGHWASPSSLDKGGEKLSVCRAFYKLSELVTEDPDFLAALSDEAATLRPAATPAIAIDIGASPGGWTDLLSRSTHSRVIAFDPGELDAHVVSRPNVVHMRELLRRDDTALIDRLKAAMAPATHADLVVCDANIPPADAAALVAYLGKCSLIAPRGRLALTLKACFRVRPSKASSTREVLKQEAVDALGAAFGDVHTRFLFANTPHELTLTAVYRGGDGPGDGDDNSASRSSSQPPLHLRIAAAQQERAGLPSRSRHAHQKRDGESERAVTVE
jgi:23S rRNA U2552 (ribose-2'-O)-methylase RlmE/FtsJ